MKWLSVLTISALALLTNACEMHKVEEPAKEPHHGADAHAAQPKDGAKPGEEAKPGEAPKFFPEKK